MWVWFTYDCYILLQVLRVHRAALIEGSLNNGSVYLTFPNLLLLSLLIFFSSSDYSSNGSDSDEEEEDDQHENTLIEEKNVSYVSSEVSTPRKMQRKIASRESGMAVMERDIMPSEFKEPARGDLLESEEGEFYNSSTATQKLCASERVNFTCS
jgi:hypothetical protein